MWAADFLFYLSHQSALLGYSYTASSTDCGNRDTETIYKMESVYQDLFLVNGLHQMDMGG
jgi:hypothetical protein